MTGKESRSRVLSPNQRLHRDRERRRLRQSNPPFVWESMEQERPKKGLQDTNREAPLTVDTSVSPCTCEVPSLWQLKGLSGP